MSDTPTAPVTFEPPLERIGIHKHVFRMALSAREQGVPQERAGDAIRECLDQWQLRRDVPDREINAAVETAYELDLSIQRVFTPAQQYGFYDHERGWPDVMKGFNEAELFSMRKVKSIVKKSSVQKVDDLRAKSGEIGDCPVRRFFYAQEFLCAGVQPFAFQTKYAADWTTEELARMQFIVPNPMRKLQGTTKQGTLSNHCRDATGPRRFLIVEFDQDGITKDMQAAILWQLHETSGALMMVVSSGGKSLHGWFLTRGAGPKALRRWFGAAVAVGADPRLWLPEQFVRMPGGTRRDAEGNVTARQEVLFINPDL